MKYFKVKSGKNIKNITWYQIELTIHCLFQKTDVMNDRKQVQSMSSYYISNKMKNAKVSANYMKKKKNYYYKKQKYNKYEKNKKNKQEYYGWMKYMKP